jgi:hypothetical protein
MWASRKFNGEKITIVVIQERHQQLAKEPRVRAIG